MRINYQPLDDTPDKVEAAIRRQQELQGLDKTTEAYARVCSRNLMEQADGLLRWNEYDEAERLARRAAALRIVYGPFEQKPQELIAADRQRPPPGPRRRGGRNGSAGLCQGGERRTESCVAAKGRGVGPPGT